MFINMSHTPQRNWEEEKKQEATWEWGPSFIDSVPPEIPEDADTGEIMMMGAAFAEDTMEFFNDDWPDDFVVISIEKDVNPVFMESFAWEVRGAIVVKPVTDDDGCFVKFQPVFDKNGCFVG